MRGVTASGYSFLLVLGGMLLSATPAAGAEYLFYLEAQAVGGYSSAADKAIFYSMAQEENMQKPSIGFDWIQRFSGEYGDVAQLALQVRLAYNASGGERDIDPVEPQVFNAFVKYKAGWADLWVGHNRPALGLGTYFDSHALLLATLAMQRFGFDRDWEVGAYRDTQWGNWAATLTTGTGAPVRFEGNWMGAGRLSWGVLTAQNFNAGLSAAFGETLETMGNEILSDDPRETALGALDATWLRDAFEHRFEVEAGRIRDEDAWALFYRFGWLLDGEGRWKVEAQPQYLSIGESEAFGFSLCLSRLVTADLTARAMYNYSDLQDDHRVLFQLYYYRL